MGNKIWVVLLVSLILLLALPVFAKGNNDSCAGEGGLFSRVFVDEYPAVCCSGLTEWQSGMDTREVVDGKCVETGLVSGNPVGTCIKCGDNICGLNETVCNCPSDCVKPEKCVCTMEYAPVCGKDGVTYSNKCEANCANASIIKEGTCDKPIVESNSNFCGGIAGIQCKEGYNCVLDGTYPDAGGKCVYDCPEYMPPLCGEGSSISVKIDEYGCKKPVCLGVSSTSTAPVSDFYLGANWVCSNGEEFKQKSEKCISYSSWKETAKKTCAQFSNEKCVSQSDANNINSDNVVTKCINSVPAYLTKFEAVEGCKESCKVFTDSEGCKNIDCGKGYTNRYCEGECEKQSIEEITTLKEKCYNNHGEVIVKTNDVGCTKYLCNMQIDSNQNLTYANSTCTLVDDLPKEKYVNCEQNGGNLLVKTNSDKCITVLECVGANNNFNFDLNKINKEIIKDEVQLLGIALKLEELKVELNKTSLKIQAISNYYEEIGDANSSIKFQNAADLLTIASNEISALKLMIKERANNFTDVDALEVKKAVQSIKTEILNKVLMILLG